MVPAPVLRRTPLSTPGTSEPNESQELNQAIVERFLSAYDDYATAFEPAWLMTDFQEEGAAAYEAYMEALEELMELDIRERVAEAWNAYAAVISKAMGAANIEAQTGEAYHEYIGAIQQAWAEIDAKSFEPATLAAVSQSLMTASWLAQASQGVDSNSFDPEISSTESST